MNKHWGGQKGIALLDLMMGMAISTIIMGGIVGLIYHEVTTTQTAKTVITTSHEISNAARWISKDAMMTESTDLVGGAQPVDGVTLSWVDRFDFVNMSHTSRYYLVDTDLRRDYDGTVTTVAREISEIQFSQTGNLLTVSITCQSPWRVADPAKTETYHICLRTVEEVQL